ncbi:MAG: recombinase RecA [Candidatus Omnitrophica bacterium]|nr:recombinase RecA [Candidatus Omnitrophota bacterium]
MSKEEKLKALNLAISQIEKEYGKESIVKLGEKKKLEVEVIPTGILSLDLALGVGGVPKGRVIEVFGPEASGKTTLALTIAAEAQKQGGIAAMIDAEHAFDPNFARKLGVDVENIYVSQPDYGEQALEIAETLVRSGAVDVVIIDSVAALVPKAEIEGEMGEAQIGLQARLMSQALRKLTAAVNKSKSVIIFINQIRHKIGVMFGSPETTTGGLALKFYASVRLEVRKSDSIKLGDEIVGSWVKVKVAKNKVAAPFKEASYEFYYDTGIDKIGCLLDVAVEEGLIEKAGSWYTYKNEKLGQGRDQVKNYLKSNEQLVKELEENIKKKFFSSNKDDEVQEKKK